MLHLALISLFLQVGTPAETPVQAGTIVQLSGNSHEQALVAKWYHSAKDMRTALKARENDMVQEMIDRHEIIVVKSGTQAIVLEINEPFARIRIRTGPSKGFIGYIELTDLQLVKK